MSAQPKPVTIVPFWNRLREVMLYPAHGSAMATIVMLGLAWLVLYIPFLIGLILWVMSMAAMYRYAFECLQMSAEGYTQPPEVSLGSNRRLGGRYIWMILIFILIAMLGRVFLGPVLGMILLVFLGVCWPSATMTLAMEESLSAALDPLKWVAIIARIGWPYLAVLGLYQVILVSDVYAVALVARFLPQAVALVLIGVISNYAIVMTFHLMGYLLYQYHEELGLVPTAPQMERSSGAPPDPDQAKLDESAALVRDGKLPEAIELLRGLIRRGGTPGVQAQYRKLLQAAGDRDGQLAHGRDYVAVLIDQDSERPAVDVLRECQAIDPAFSPESALHVTKLAHWAARLGQPQAALQLVTGFQERFPKSQYAAANGLLAAQLLHDKMGRDEEARDVLLKLKTTLPNDPIIADIDAKLQSIERMIAATAKKPAAPSQGSAPG
ncbi:MAG TPA: hypothetical protein VGH80_10180 [Xanthomonadaceae bacterium]|jgi:tetratricopeptide (TPR) repeat protein